MAGTELLKNFRIVLEGEVIYLHIFPFVIPALNQFYDSNYKLSQVPLLRILRLY